MIAGSGFDSDSGLRSQEDLRVMANYTESFYQTYAGDSRKSAEQVVPLIQELLSPASVVDIGCGIGTWLCVFQEHGVERALGVDGDYVNRGQLLISPEDFVARDLTRPLSLPGDVERPFDLVLSLEVAEHLPESCAEQFVADLVSLGPAVLFSAAIPHQGGKFHVNEQWQTYWAMLFENHGYSTIDWLRPRIWGNRDVAYYYSQNSILYVNRHQLEKVPELRDHVVVAASGTLSKVHPIKWHEANDLRSLSLAKVLRALPHSVSKAARRRLRRFLGHH